MMFPGHPYLRQETRRAEQRGERQECERVLRLIDNRLASYRRDPAKDARRVVRLLEELRRAVQQGHQR